MTHYQGTTGSHPSWEETYRNTPAGDLPWNAGMVDGDLMDWLVAGRPNPGNAYDLGCGPGNDAAFLAQEGWNVTAVDIAPSAVELAKQTAARAGVEGKIQFQVADVLTLSEDGNASLVHDRGCFHTLSSESWPAYVGMAAGLLREKGILALKVFSFKEPQMTAGAGPYRFTAEDLKKVFGGAFELTVLRESVFHGPRKPFSYFCVFEKKVRP